MRGKGIHLSDKTLKMTVGARPLTVGRSRCIMGTVIILRVSQRQKSTTAMISCERRKKRGALVTFNTHLLLEDGLLSERVVGIPRGRRTPLSSGRRKYKTNRYEMITDVPQARRQDRKRL
jgi:hypothetical protein